MPDTGLSSAGPAMTNHAIPISASLRRRLVSLFYEGLLLLAVWFVAGFLVVGLLPQAPTGGARMAFQVYLWAVAGAYFVWCWHRGGQTLAMRTWRLRVVDREGDIPSWSRAAMRFLWATLGVLGAGIGFVWAFFDRDGLFLHDRLGGTRVVDATKQSV